MPRNGKLAVHHLSADKMLHFKHYVDPTWRVEDDEAEPPRLLGVLRLDHHNVDSSIQLTQISILNKRRTIIYDAG